MTQETCFANGTCVWFFQVGEYLVNIEETETKHYVWLLMW